MSRIPYASAIGSLMYVMLCTRPDIYFAMGRVSKYQSNPREEHWYTIKYILKYLKGIRDYVLVYRADDLVPVRYTDLNFQADKNKRKSTNSYVFIFLGVRFHEKVSSNLTLLIPPRRLSTWQFQKCLKRQFGSGSS
jgi:hypothetical protein